MRTATFAFVFSVATAAAAKAEWEPMIGGMLANEKLGFGGLTGVVVDPQSGNVFIWLSDKGLYQSEDQGKTFSQVLPMRGRTETPGCMQMSPAGPAKGWLIALVYNGPILHSADGKSFNPMDKKSSHVDWAAMSWASPAPKLVFTLKHESGDLLMVSQDGGKTFSDVGKGFGPVCVFDDETAVAVRALPAEGKKTPDHILARTTDGGKSFTKVAEYRTKALPVRFDNNAYWLVDGAIISSKDKGATWEAISNIKGGIYGPVFGKDARHMFVTTAAGIVETVNGGQTWFPPIPAPKEFKGIQQMTWLAFDAQRDILYLSKMGSDLYRLRR